MLLILALACSKSVPPPDATAVPAPPAETAVAAPGTSAVTPPVVAQPQIVAFGPVPAAIADHYQPEPVALAGCELIVDAQIAWLAQLSCPQDRIVTDMRGAGVPSLDGSLQLVMETLMGMGLSAMPRQASQTLADGTTPVQVVDAVSEGLEVTTWVVHNAGATPQLLTCMGLTEDADARAFCLSAMADMIVSQGD